MEEKEPKHIVIASLLWHVIGEKHLINFLLVDQVDLAKEYGIRLIKDVQEDRYIKALIGGLSHLRQYQNSPYAYREDLVDKVIEVLDTKIKDVPLYINDEEKLVKALAKKRLEIGK